MFDLCLMWYMVHAVWLWYASQFSNTFAKKVNLLISSESTLSDSEPSSKQMNRKAFPVIVGGRSSSLDDLRSRKFLVSLLVATDILPMIILEGPFWLELGVYLLQRSMGCGNLARLRVLIWGPAPQDSHTRIPLENVSPVSSGRSTDTCFLSAGEVSPSSSGVVKAFVLYLPHVLSICWALLLLTSPSRV